MLIKCDGILYRSGSSPSLKWTKHNCATSKYLDNSHKYRQELKWNISLLQSGCVVRARKTIRHLISGGYPSPIVVQTRCGTDRCLRMTLLYRKGYISLFLIERTIKSPFTQRSNIVYATTSNKDFRSCNPITCEVRIINLVTDTLRSRDTWTTKVMMNHSKSGYCYMIK